MVTFFSNMLRCWYFLVFIGFSYVNPGYSEAFGNNAIQIPKIGVSFFDSVIKWHKKPWGISHQWTIGTSFMQALNYRWWWVVETNFALGKTLTPPHSFLSVLLFGAGVRFNFLQYNIRPHTGLLVHYLHFLGEGVSSMPLNGGWPIFVGLKPYVGVEWLFYSEMALAIDCGYGIYINIREPLRQVFYTSFAFALYF